MRVRALLAGVALSVVLFVSNAVPALATAVPAAPEVEWIEVEITPEELLARVVVTSTVRRVQPANTMMVWQRRLEDPVPGTAADSESATDWHYGTPGTVKAPQDVQRPVRDQDNGVPKFDIDAGGGVSSGYVPDLGRPIDGTEPADGLPGSDDAAPVPAPHTQAADTHGEESPQNDPAVDPPSSSSSTSTKSSSSTSSSSAPSSADSSSESSSTSSKSSSARLWVVSVIGGTAIGLTMWALVREQRRKRQASRARLQSGARHTPNDLQTVLSPTSRVQHESGSTGRVLLANGNYTRGQAAAALTGTAANPTSQLATTDEYGNVVRTAVHEAILAMETDDNLAAVEHSSQSEDSLDQNPAHQPRRQRGTPPLAPPSAYRVHLDTGVLLYDCGTEDDITKDSFQEAFQRTTPVRRSASPVDGLLRAGPRSSRSASGSSLRSSSASAMPHTAGFVPPSCGKDALDNGAEADNELSDGSDSESDTGRNVRRASKSRTRQTSSPRPCLGGDGTRSLVDHDENPMEVTSELGVLGDLQLWFQQKLGVIVPAETIVKHTLTDAVVRIPEAQGVPHKHPGDGSMITAVLDEVNTGEEATSPVAAAAGAKTRTLAATTPTASAAGAPVRPSRSSAGSPDAEAHLQVDGAWAHDPSGDSTLGSIDSHDLVVGGASRTLSFSEIIVGGHGIGDVGAGSRADQPLGSDSDIEDGHRAASGLDLGIDDPNSAYRHPVRRVRPTRSPRPPPVPGQTVFV